MAEFVDIKELGNIGNIVRPALESVFSAGEKIAIKLHMGEEGNKYYLKPELVKVFVELLKGAGAKPFLIDSIAMYPGARDSVEKYLKTAKKHGFDDICKVVISKDSVNYPTENLNVEVCKELVDADGMLVLTHVKGHVCAGFGGAIKNLGMGGVSDKTKKDIHYGGQPVIDAEKCTGCRLCEKNCFCSAVKVVDGVAKVNKGGCWGCSICVINCPSKAMKTKVAMFDTLLAESAFAVMKNVKKAYFVNVLKDITKLCDCCSDPEGIVLDDIGIVYGKDIIDIEKKSLELINKKAGKDLFLELHKKSPKLHIQEYEKLK